MLAAMMIPRENFGRKEALVTKKSIHAHKMNNLK